MIINLQEESQSWDGNDRTAYGLVRTAELDTIEVLEHLPALQQLLLRLLGCKPEGAAVYNSVIHCALSIVVGESMKIYNAINGCTVNLVDRFFDMQRHDAIRALEIYRRAGQQAERLSNFYEICKRSDFGRGQKFVKIEKPPASFVAAMEEYVKAASPQLLSHKIVVEPNKRIAGPMPKLAIEHKKVELNDKKPQQPTRPPIQLTQLATDLPVAESAQAPVPVQEPVSDLLVAPFDKLTLGSLYGDEISRTTNQNSSYEMVHVAPNPFKSAQYTQDPFYDASDGIALPANVQMATMAKQQALVRGRQQQAMSHDKNPFGNPFGPTAVSSYPAQDPYTSLF